MAADEEVADYEEGGETVGREEAGYKAAEGREETLRVEHVVSIINPTR